MFRYNKFVVLTQTQIETPDLIDYETKYLLVLIMTRKIIINLNTVVRNVRNSLLVFNGYSLLYFREQLHSNEKKLVK